MSHKKGCEWESFGLYLYNEGFNRDNSVTINETGIHYQDNVRKGNTKEDIVLEFKYCPICGCEI